MKHLVTDIQRFCMHDGPGIRTTVFLKGCPLNCFWCHNPETKKAAPQLMYYETKCIGCRACLACKNRVHYEADGKHSLRLQHCTACGECAKACPTGAISIAGKYMESDEIIELALRDKAFYGKNGGITLSGGEPMLHPEKCIELLAKARQAGLNTAVETSGFFPKKYVEKLCNVTDTLLWDVKDTDAKRHKHNTGVSNEIILDNLRYADSFNVPIILRCILLKGVNLNDEHLSRVNELFSSLKNAVRVELLPCHGMGECKLNAIGSMEQDLRPFIPTAEEINRIANRYPFICN